MLDLNPWRSLAPPPGRNGDLLAMFDNKGAEARAPGAPPQKKPKDLRTLAHKGDVLCCAFALTGHEAPPPCCF